MYQTPSIIGSISLSLFGHRLFFFSRLVSVTETQALPLFRFSHSRQISRDNSMEEQREEGEFSGDCRESVEKAGKGSEIEILGGEVDVPQQDPSIKDANTVENSDLGVCDVSGTDENPTDGGLATEDGSLKPGGGNSAVETKDSVEKTDDVERTDAITELEIERSSEVCEGDAGAVEVEIKKIIVKSVDERVSETVKLGEVEMEDEMAMPEIKRKNGASHESAEEKESETSDVNEVTDEKAKCEVEDNSCASDAKQNVRTGMSRQSSVDADMFSASENKADREKESTKQSEKDSNKLGVDREQEKEEKVGVSYNEQGSSGCETSDAGQEKESVKKSEDDNNNEMDVDSKHADEENVGLNKQGNLGSETTDAKPSESAQVPEESTQLIEGETNEGNPGAGSDVSSAAEICREEEITNVNQKEENGEAMEIDNTAEEQAEKDIEVDGALDNAGNGSAGASMIETQDVPVAEAERNDSNVKEMEIDERNDNVDMATDLTGTIESADLANPNSPIEDAATGNIQDLKTETGDASLKEDKKATDMAGEVAREDSKDTLKSVDSTVNAESSEACVVLGAESSAAAKDCPRVASDEILGSDEYQEDKDHERLDKKTVDQLDEMREEDDNAHEAPIVDPNQKEDTEMEENPNNSDYADDGTDSYMKTNGVKRKADVLSEDSPREGRKTVSFAKVSFAHTSFKIGACIAKAASQMAGSPSVLKSNNFGDETLSVESFVSQLHCAATEPVKENVVSETAAGFFVDFRNSSASQQVTPEKLSSKRPSNSNVEGTEAFEFEEMGDTYWTDKVINNGVEEQTPPTEKAKYQIVPVELKPAQVQRTRRPYRRRQSQISIPHSVSEKPANFDENAPAELIMNFSETDTIPPEKSLSKMFRHFGPIRESETEVDKENNRARVVYRKGADAEVAYNSAGRFSIFGPKAVNYELSYTITETFKVKPYVVSLGEEDAALCPPA